MRRTPRGGWPAPAIGKNRYLPVREMNWPDAVDETMIDAQIKRIREQHGEWVDIVRPLALDDYATLDIEPGTMTARFRALADVTAPTTEVATLKSFVVEDGRPGPVNV